MSSLSVLSEGEGKIVADVVFVHGLRGDKLSTWTKGSVCWPKDLLKDDLQDCRIMTWGYDSSIAHFKDYSSQASIFGHAGNLLADLSGMRRDDDANSRFIIFVGHSLGGLVIKEALLKASEHYHNKRNKRLGAIYPCTVGVLFMGTPHRGSPITPLAKFVANAAWAAFRQPNDELVRTLSEESVVLERQRDAFSGISQYISLYCLYEEIPMYGQMIVPESSACIDGFNVSKNSIPANHEDMCKFESKNEAGYKRTSGFLIDIRDDVVKNERAREMKATEDNRQLYQVILETLKFVEMEDRRDQIARAHKKTFDWIFRRHDEERMRLIVSRTKEDFVSWLRESSGIFWITGKAGSGKSTLMKYICQDQRTHNYLQSWSSEQDYIFVEFYFWANGGPEQKSQTGLMRALLFSILQHAPSLIPHIMTDQWKSLNRTGSSCLVNQELACSPSDVKRAFEKLLVFLERDVLPMNMCFFIDGLDEYEGTDAEINDLIARILELNLSSNKRLKICLSCRPHADFVMQYSQCPGFKMEDLTVKDIEIYIRDRLFKHKVVEKYRFRDSTFLDDTVLGIRQKAFGVFLWVKLVLDIILQAITDGNSPGQLKARLKAIMERLPPELKSLYATMLAKIKPEYLEDTRKYFIFVRNSKDPPSIMTMTLFSMTHEDAVRAYYEFDEDMALEHCSEQERMISSRCGGLLVLQPSHFSTLRLGTTLGRTVNFLHRTVQEYLEEKDFFNPVMKVDDHALVWLVSCMLEHKFCAAKCPAGVSYAQTWNWKKEIYRCYYYAAMVSRQAGLKYSSLLDEIGPVTQQCWQTMIHALDLNSWVAEPDLEIPEPLVLAVWSGIFQLVEQGVICENLPKLCPHREPLLRFAVSFGSGESETASLNPKAVKLLLECGADPLECKTPSRRLLPSDAISPFETFFENFQYCKRDGRLFATTSDDNHAEPLLNKCLTIIGLLWAHSTRRKKNAWQLAMAETREGENGIRLWEFLTELEQLSSYEAQISETKQVLLRTGYLLQSKDFKLPSEVPATIARARPVIGANLNATTQIYEVKLALIQASKWWACDRIFLAQRDTLNGIVKESTEIWEIKQLFSEAIQRRIHLKYCNKWKPKRDVSSEASILKDLHSPRDTNKETVITWNSEQISRVIMLTAQRPAVLEFCLEVSEAIFSLATQNQIAQCYILANDNSRSIFEDHAYNSGRGNRPSHHYGNEHESTYWEQWTHDMEKYKVGSYGPLVAQIIGDIFFASIFIIYIPEHWSSLRNKYEEMVHLKSECSHPEAYIHTVECDAMQENNLSNSREFARYIIEGTKRPDRVSAITENLNGKLQEICYMAALIVHVYMVQISSNIPHSLCDIVRSKYHYQRIDYPRISSRYRSTSRRSPALEWSDDGAIWSDDDAKWSDKSDNDNEIRMEHGSCHWKLTWRTSSCDWLDRHPMAELSLKVHPRDPPIVGNPRVYSAIRHTPKQSIR